VSNTLGQQQVVVIDDPDELMDTMAQTAAVPIAAVPLAPAKPVQTILPMQFAQVTPPPAPQPVPQQMMPMAMN
jgi:hypothetical protein